MAVALRGADNFNPDRLRNMKAIFTGGAPHPEAQIREWLADDIPIVDGYGMSEAGTVFGMPLDMGLIDRKAGCVGVSTPRLQARLVDAEGSPVAPGEAGELQLKGPNITCGYWRREADFKAALTGDGWFRTGDILTQDEDGFFKVTDRKKDMFISGGENVYPAEVEALLIKYPGIAELAIAGVPDDRWGEVGCLFYVPKAGELALADIEKFLDGKLARYKVPKRMLALKELPRNGVGKVLKHELRRMATD
ncbi:MAG: AMP-binding protein [Alphaproteobacteria bacterium]|nr:AMP-binding protein [Alphaproteobacteria bacterium]